jgi:cysteinyl-tRNA synthetase
MLLTVSLQITRFILNPATKALNSRAGNQLLGLFHSNRFGMKFEMKFRFYASLVATTAVLFLVTALAPAFSQQPRLAHVRSWAYQLQEVDPLEIAQSPYDLVTIDYALEKQIHAMPPEIVDMMRRKPDGSRRYVLAYLSIGEAENYRYYWRNSWLVDRPGWLERENPDWPGNFAVKYWDPAWQSILFGSPNSYLDQIIDAQFDGVYLDGIDGFERREAGRPAAMTEMADLIAKLATYARSRRKDFLVVPQNAEAILADPRIVPMIDGFAREDLLYNENRKGKPNSARTIRETVTKLKAVRRAGKPVLVVEYVRDRTLAAKLRQQISAFDFVGYIAKRELRELGWLQNR